jgi:hypothetical protein
MNDLGSLCVCVVLIIIVIMAYDKYMGKKSNFSQGFITDSQQYGPENGAYTFYDYSGYSGPSMYRDQNGVNPYTLARTYN